MPNLPYLTGGAASGFRCHNVLPGPRPVAVVLGLVVLAWTPLLGQAGRAQIGGLRAFTQTSDGNWRTVVRTPDGKAVQWVYVPPTKFTASVRTHLTVLDPSRARIVYEYFISNAPTSTQHVAWLHFGPGVPVNAAIRRAPNKWDTDVQPGWAMAIGPGYPPFGILPGSLDAVHLEASNLPGAMTIAAQGNVGVPQIPGELSEQQEKELDQLSRFSTVELPAIGPVIPAGLAEPELTLQVLLARVGMHYGEHLTKSRHPHASDLIPALQRAAQKTGGVGAVRGDLQAIRAITVKPVSDPWHQDVSQALRVAVDLMLEGHVPLK